MKTALICAALLAAAIAGSAVAANLDQGKEIYGTCAGCHGEYAQGGKHGEYPRLAGQRLIYLRDQLQSFRARHRINIPMFPYTQERELSDEDIDNVTAYIAAIELPTKPPEFAEGTDALTRLLAMDKVLIIARTEGDAAKGRRLYVDGCVDCHKKEGRGGGHIPMIVGQYTNYLTKQIDAFVRKERPHDENTPGGVLNGLTEENVRDIIAYLTVLQHGEAAEDSAVARK